MNIDCKKNQEEFVELLRSTKREGIEYVIEDLEKDGFSRLPRQPATILMWLEVSACTA